jgi:plastocyanin
MVATVVALVAVSMTQSAGAAVQIKGVHTAAGYRWQPKAVTVAVGTKVVWTAVMGSHTVTAYKGKWTKSTTLPQGSTTSFTFKSAGVYKFRCRFHSTLVNGVCSGMCGRVVVG